MATIVYDDGNYAGIEAIEEMEFMLRGANWNDTVISWNMVFDSAMGIMVPSDRATALKCPGAA
jgi:hypothetical protein